MLFPVRINPKIPQERRRTAAVFEGKGLSGDSVHLRMRRHPVKRLGRSEIVAAEGDYVSLRRQFDGVGQIGLAESEEAATEGGEDAWDKRIAEFTLHCVFVRVDVAAAECGFSVREFDHVKHPIAFEKMVGPLWEEIRVWAVADVGPAVEAAGEGALHRGAGGRGELLDGGEVAGEDLFGVEEGGEGKVDEVTYEVI
ncbi:hypothetical protein SASPL_143361 [Salvia splendens]|uniref:Uncharacterized protein n=1 Tax=Salvia splendens TaxID=180675 RepID=A0A8X8Z9Y1_SALSN|nr:hypothetical protein SASPL_143361 [Salvia splendens]